MGLKWKTGLEGNIYTVWLTYGTWLELLLNYIIVRWKLVANICNLVILQETKSNNVHLMTKRLSSMQSLRQKIQTHVTKNIPQISCSWQLQYQLSFFLFSSSGPWPERLLLQLPCIPPFCLLLCFVRTACWDERFASARLSCTGRACMLFMAGRWRRGDLPVCLMSWAPTKKEQYYYLNLPI